MQCITKGDFRKKCIDRLKFCSKHSKLSKSKIISKEIFEIIKFEKPKKILVYIPLGIEVDIKGLIDKLRRRRYRLFIPYMVGDSLKIVPYRLPLIKKRYGIKESKNSNLKYKVRLDLAIVPIIGTDLTFRRIGFGVGFYDRFFESLDYKPKTIFTQLCLCSATNILTLKHDIKADYLVTNKERYGTNNSSINRFNSRWGNRLFNSKKD